MRVVEADGVKLANASWTVVKSGNGLGVFATKYTSFKLTFKLNNSLATYSATARATNMPTPHTVYSEERKDSLNDAIELWFKLIADKGLTYVQLGARSAK